MASRRSFLTGALWLAAAGGVAWLWRDQLFGPMFAIEGDPTGSGLLPFVAGRTDLPVIEVGVEGRRVPALVDSGAQRSVIDRAFADALALPSTWTPPMVAFGLGGSSQVGRGVSFDLDIGALTLPLFRAVALRLGPIAAASGLAAPLVIGQDILGALVANFDFPGRTVAFHRRGAFTPPPQAVAAAARISGRALQVTVTVEGKAFEVVLDTGASAAVSLSRAAAGEAGLLSGRRIRRSSAVVLGGLTESGVIRANVMEFAGRTFPDVDVHIFDAPDAPGFPKGLLGVGALAGGRAILDLGGGRLWLAPSEDPDRSSRARLAQPSP